MERSEYIQQLKGAKAEEEGKMLQSDPVDCGGGRVPEESEVEASDPVVRGAEADLSSSSSSGTAFPALPKSAASLDADVPIPPVDTPLIKVSRWASRPPRILSPPEDLRSKLQESVSSSPGFAASILSHTPGSLPPGWSMRFATA